MSTAGGRSMVAAAAIGGGVEVAGWPVRGRPAEILALRRWWCWLAATVARFVQVSGMAMSRRGAEFASVPMIERMSGRARGRRRPLDPDLIGVDAFGRAEGDEGRVAPPLATRGRLDAAIGAPPSKPVGAAA